MAKYNKELFKIAQYELTKHGFVDAQTIAAGADGGMAPPGADPSAMPPGGDPAAMAGAGAPPGGDPSAMAGGGDPTLEGMPPEMAQMLQGGGDPSMSAPPTGGGAMGEASSAGAPVPEITPSGGSDPNDVKNKIKEVLQETGVIKAPKMKPEEQFQYIVSVLGSVCEKLGISMPPIPDPADKPKENGSSSSGGAMTNGASGKPSSQSSSSGSSSQTKSAGAKAAELIRKLKH